MHIWSGEVIWGGVCRYTYWWLWNPAQKFLYFVRRKFEGIFVSPAIIAEGETWVLFFSESINFALGQFLKKYKSDSK